jgi:CobQ-like glutamine amidotransferase family enzyme
MLVHRALRSDNMITNLKIPTAQYSHSRKNAELSKRIIATSVDVKFVIQIDITCIKRQLSTRKESKQEPYMHTTFKRF